MRLIAQFIGLLSCSLLLMHSIPAKAAVAEGPFTGSSTIPVTDDGILIDNFDKKRFPEFVREALRRYFRYGGSINPRATASSSIVDIELISQSKCLASGLTVSGWQKLRFEFLYKIDDVYWAQTSNVRYQILVRIISGEVADFQLENEPPQERFNRVPTNELTDLATRLAGFIRREMSLQCFDKFNLTLCSVSTKDICS